MVIKTSSEMRGFVFSIVFIVIFAALLGSVPTGLNGEGTTPDDITPLDPSFVTGYSEKANWSITDIDSPIALGFNYQYELNTKDWLFSWLASSYFKLGSKIVFAGFLWLGTQAFVNFISQNNENYGTTISYDDIESDSIDGYAIYTLVYADNGNSAGDLRIYWNSTEYTDFEDAIDNDDAYFLHGVGFEDSSAMNMGSLLLQLMFLQLPDVPTLLNLLIAVPLWATIIFTVWFIIKETLPFV